MNILLALTILLAPTYVIRFNIFNQPTNLLMVWVLAVWIIFAGLLTIKKQWPDFFASIATVDKKLFILISLFFLAGLISLCYPAFDTKKLGQFIVLFLQPISLFFITQYTIRKNNNTFHFLLSTFYLFVALSGLFAIIQYFTRLGLPTAYWGNADEPKRALSFFIHPNFYALFIAPLLAFLIPDVTASLKYKILNLKSFSWVLGALGILLSLSRGGWMGLAAAITIFIIVAGDKKIRKVILAAVIVIAIIIVSVPNLRYRLLLPFHGEKSTVSRFSLLTTGWKMVKDSPVLGKGLLGFDRNFNTYNTDPGLDHLDFPHNIFLNFWIDTGLLGLISFLGLLIYFFKKGLHFLRTGVIPGAAEESQHIDSSPQMHSVQNDAWVKLSLSLFLITLLIHGLIDVPYLKNDLALIFWMIIAIGI